MFAQCKWVLIYNMVIISFLCFDTICTTNAMRFTGIVENITVYAIKDENNLQSDNMLKSLKLNISWMPPNKGKQPSSYSIIITCIPKVTDINKKECIESSAFYNVQNKSPFSLLVPQNKLLNDMPEIQIRPNCTYKIQVYANPRAKPVGKLPEVIYTVPKCINRKCSCMDAKMTLPIPKVKVIQTKKNVVINWNITSNSSYVHSYIISIGIPLSTSKAGYFIYNITKIGNVTSTKNTFNWDLKINNQYVKIENGYKILVEALDYRGCSGTQGSFTVINIDKIKTLNGNIVWLLLAGVTMCVILGFISIVSIRNKTEYQLEWPFRQKQTIPGFSAYKLTQWPNLVSQNNIGTYVEQNLEENCCKTQNDKFEVPYKYINLIYELGKGQFGRVYLGSLNNDEDTLVAVKMLQCSDTSNEPEARHQLLEEIKIMKAAGSHPHLVSLIGCCTLPDNPICILLEYMEGGNLLAYLHSRRRVELDDLSWYCFEKTRYVNVIEKNKKKDEDLCGEIKRQQFIKFALDIARGMEHLEGKGITHRDLAARNILLASDLTLKVSDFGLSRNGIYVINHMVGKVCQLPIRWMSPEAIRDHAFSSKSDVWSFGVILWEIGTLGSFPYANIQNDDLMRYLIQDKCRLACPNIVSHDIYNIMCSCWNTVPHNRPSFAQLVLDLQTLKEPLYFMHETSNPCYTLLSL
ncbi:vascular endothelial growth factor receptor 3-like [Formica exsecta]|uniref:vascular endothelial growth factor receptor 3-like n=1 Tax=Formica exsecta TaxID=72781 RepID=UPI0011412089|nr:vascular endothelial growth factor receptor 3-like [Formica exsecta]